MIKPLVFGIQKAFQMFLCILPENKYTSLYCDQCAFPEIVIQRPSVLCPMAYIFGHRNRSCYTLSQYRACLSLHNIWSFVSFPMTSHFGYWNCTCSFASRPRLYHSIRHTAMSVLSPWPPVFGAAKAVVLFPKDRTSALLHKTLPSSPQLCLHRLMDFQRRLPIWLSSWRRFLPHLTPMNLDKLLLICPRMPMTMRWEPPAVGARPKLCNFSNPVYCCFIVL